MPQLNASLKVATGSSSTDTTLSYETTPFVWTVDVTRYSTKTEANELLKLDTNSGYLLLDGEVSTTSMLPIGSSIIGNKIRWVDTQTLIFESSQSGSRRLYTHDTRTGNTTQVSIFGADHLFADGGVWARWLSGDGYQDSNDRGSDEYGVAGVDTDGTVLVILDAATQVGLGYLLPTHTSVNNTVAFTYNILQGTRPAAIRNQIVVFKSDEVLHQYHVVTEERTFSNVPLEFQQNAGEWIVGHHALGLGYVAFNLNSPIGWILGPAASNYNADVRISDNMERVTVVTNKASDELRYGNQQYIVVPRVVDNSPLAQNLYSHRLANRPIISPTTTPVDFGAGLVGSDAITVWANTTTNSGTSVAKVIRSTDWFGTSGGKDIRGAWQYGVTAVVASTNTSGSANVTVKDSNNNTYAAGEAAYGNSSVMIRPAVDSTYASPLWEITWTRSATTYARVILNDTLTAVTPITEYAGITFNTAGILDIDTNTNLPIAATANEDVWYGYVKLQYPSTRGTWTVGKDVSPSCPASVTRIVAWNATTQTAYVVWNANTRHCEETIENITLPARIAVEYNSFGVESAAVVIPQRDMIIHEYQWQLLSEQALLRSVAVGTK